MIYNINKDSGSPKLTLADARLGTGNPKIETLACRVHNLQRRGLLMRVDLSTNGVGRRSSFSVLFRIVRVDTSPLIEPVLLGHGCLFVDDLWY
jgi:hypothetical protein